MDRPKLLGLYEAQMRRDAFVPGMNSQKLPEVTRYLDTAGLESLIMWHRFGDAEAEAIVARELDYFSANAKEFTWKIYAGDQPIQLPALLEQANVKAQRTDKLMICETGKFAGEARAQHIRTLFRTEEIADLLSVWESVWPGESGGWATILGDELKRAPERVRVLIAYDGEQPVASSYIILDPRKTFAYLGGGATLASHRGRGLYRSLVAARARIAEAEGIANLAVEASPESAPILARLGFEVLTELRFFERE